MKASNETRYFVTDAVSIPVMRLRKKGEAYRMATGPGWGVVDTDENRVLYCDEDASAVLYPEFGSEFVIAPYEEVNLKNAPKQSEVVAIIESNSCGYSFWQKDEGYIKIFVTYDKNGLIDTYRLDNWNGKPYDGETEISFSDLQSEYDHDNTNRAEITGTFEYEKKLNEAAA
jgi:hypothetical protein